MKHLNSSVQYIFTASFNLKSCPIGVVEFKSWRNGQFVLVTSKNTLRNQNHMTRQEPRSRKRTGERPTVICENCSGRKRKRRCTDCWSEISSFICWSSPVENCSCLSSPSFQDLFLLTFLKIYGIFHFTQVGRLIH